jgi:hypothetical protein
MTSEEKKYKKWITTLPCVVCQSPGVEHDTGEILNNPCHIVSRGAGGKIFGNLLPMCQSHHQEQHRLLWGEWAAKYQIGPFTKGIELQKEYECLRDHHGESSISFK